MIKQTVYESQFIDELMSDEYANWSYNGAKALYEYLEQLSEDIGEDIEMDRVALRCDYSEYKSAWEAMSQYQPEDMPTIEDKGVDESGHGMDLVEIETAQQALALAWLHAQTAVIEFDGGIIIQQF